MKNKKAQTGDLLTAIPTFLIILFVMIIFSVLSGILSQVKTIETTTSFSGNPSQENPFLQTIKTNMSNQKEEMLFFDAIMLRRKKLIDEEKFLQIIKSLTAKEDTCLSIWTSKSNLYPDQDWGIGNIKNKGYQELPPYGTLSITYQYSYIKFQNENEEIEIKYYYGPCKE